MKQKAWDILAARPDYDGAKTMLKGQKITSFFMDIMGEFNVTIDGHARNIAYGERIGLTDDRTNIGKKEYRALQAAYEEAARRVGLMPYQLQAITGGVWRVTTAYRDKQCDTKLSGIHNGFLFFVRAGLAGGSDRRRDDGQPIIFPNDAKYFCLVGSTALNPCYDSITGRLWPATARRRKWHA